MADVRVAQAGTMIVTDLTSPEVRATQVGVIALSSIPAPEVRSQQVGVMVAASAPAPEVRSQQTGVMAVGIGRVRDPQVRAWTFTLDGHDFYVLRLGNQETLVFDMLSQQWYRWADTDSSLWGAYTGANWVEGNRFSADKGSNILVGSDANGSLFFLDPDKDEDDSASEGREPSPFVRRVTAQIPVRGYDRFALYEVQLIGSTSQVEDSELTDINLSYSDDRAATYQDAGTVSIDQGDLDARATWRSLGSFRLPGRIIRIEDDGALKRIDSLTMNIDAS